MPHSVVAYVGMTPAFASAIEALQPGDAIQDQGYVSATIAPLAPRHLTETKVDGGEHLGKASVHKILVPHGSLALPVSADDDTEILIARGSRYRWRRP